MRALGPTLRLALAGVAPARWSPPAWLLTHQRDVARRLGSALDAFGGALLADSVGLGKSYVALALAARAGGAALVVPAVLRAQWRELAAAHGLAPRLVTHEALSRGARLPAAPLIVVDEAHRFRSATTRRYDALARQLRDAPLLLLTATPVVNHPGELVALLRLFLPDNALAALGVPSLEDAAQRHDLTGLAAALAPLMVARSAATARPPGPFPRVTSARVRRPPPVAPPRFAPLTRAIAALRFPAFGPEAAPLLRRHLYARLASSVEACRESVGRHRAYLDRALCAARRGERLSRRAARRIFGPDDHGQLELGLTLGTPAPLAADRLTDELARLDRLRALLDGDAPAPKLDACVRLLQRRRGRKTLVFTAARATARALGAALGWRRTAVVAARGAEIASGRLPVSEALRLFAPRAQGGPPTSVAALEIDTLIATDVASEGLNLQDADAVVHYDVPWTPLALEQRLGRIRRLGSPHRRLRVWWFAPPRALERRLRLTSRVHQKATIQVALGTPRTSVVGRTDAGVGALDRREALRLETAHEVVGHALTDAGPSLAVVQWATGSELVYQLLAGSGASHDPAGLVASALEARDAPRTSTSAIAPWLVHQLTARITSAGRPPCHPTGLLLAREIIRQARVAARRRDADLLALLDGALGATRDGLTAGAERSLGSALSSRDALRNWLRQWRYRGPRLRLPRVVATIEPAVLGGR